MLVKFQKKELASIVEMSLTIIDVSDPEYKCLGYYDPANRDPVAVFLKDADYGAGIFLFDDKTCFVGKKYFEPVKL